MIIGAIGCNLAWGIVDAIMYVMNSLAERGRHVVSFREAPSRAGPGSSAPGHRGRAALLSSRSVSTEEELESLRQRLTTLPEPPRHAAPAARRPSCRAGRVPSRLPVDLPRGPSVLPRLRRRTGPALLQRDRDLHAPRGGRPKHGRYAGFRPWRRRSSWSRSASCSSPPRSRWADEAPRLATAAFLAFAAGSLRAQEEPAPAAPGRWSRPRPGSSARSVPFPPEDTDYGQPTVTADHGALHLEARYNDEGIGTGSAWVGWNVGVGEQLLAPRSSRAASSATRTGSPRATN